MNSRGYTLIESVIVLSLVGVLLATSAYSLVHAMQREEIDGWVRSITYDIAGGQQAAITRRTMVTATFQDSTYSIVAGSTVLRQQTLPNEITFGATLRTVNFDRRGTPSGALTLTLKNPKTERSYTIVIDSGTGRASYSEP